MSGSIRLAVKIICMVALVLALAACEMGSDASETQNEEPVTVVPGEESSAEAVNGEKINLNDMTREELRETIPDFSNRMVREFFEYQPYISIQQFRREMGKYIGAEQIAGYEEYVFVPVDINESDSETVQQLPGVDAAIADTLLASRPFDTNDRFLELLADHVSSAQLDQAVYYLSE